MMTVKQHAAKKYISRLQASGQKFLSGNTSLVFEHTISMQFYNMRALLLFQANIDRSLVF